MNYKSTALLIATCLFSAAAFAGEKMIHKIAIEIADSSDDGEIRIVLDSDDLGFSLHDMQLGENQAIVDKEGRSILITRTEEGFRFEVDGKTINMPAFDSDMNLHVTHDELSEDGQHHVRVIKKTVEVEVSE